ncbi:uncharacterized protein [Dendrobates tinctorius]|uniref:uncharacterized protein n=1 Tax=Dendrobates tinctorius TaxID=92724 RepID=UPI003CC9F2C0
MLKAMQSGTSIKTRFHFSLEIFFNDIKKNEKQRDLRGAFSDTEDYLDQGLVSSNRCASRTSSIGSWSEFIKPSFTQKLTFRSVLEGEPAVFRCKLVACPAPNISWFHNNKPIGKEKRRVVKTESAMHIHFCSLFIKEVEDRDSGSYRIFAINSEGSAESTASLLVALKEEQNPKYLDFVRFSEKTHESIDSLVQKKRESKLKVDLKCVGSPHDKRRETQILRNQYPKRGIVKTISFEKIISGETQSKGKRRKKLDSDKLLDKEIQAKLQKLRELKRARGSRSSIYSSDLYSDMDLESLQSDTSFHFEKETHKFSSFLDVPWEPKIVAGLNELPFSIPQIIEPGISNEPQEIRETGIFDSSILKNAEDETRIIHNERISAVGKRTFNEIIIECDQQKDKIEQTRPFLNIDIVLLNIKNDPAVEIDSTLELTEPIQMNEPIKSKVLQDRSEISYVSQTAQKFSHSEVKFFQSPDIHDTLADASDEIPRDNINFPVQPHKEPKDLTKLESFSAKPFLESMQKEAMNKLETFEETIQMNKPVRSKIRQGPFQASNTYQSYTDMVQEEHKKSSNKDLKYAKFAHVAGLQSHDNKDNEHRMEHTFLPGEFKLQEKNQTIGHITSRTYDEIYSPKVEHKTDVEMEAFDNLTKSVKVSQEEIHKDQILSDDILEKQKPVMEINSSKPITVTGDLQKQMQDSRLDASEPIEMYTPVKSRIFQSSSEGRLEYISAQQIIEEKLSLREHEKIHELIDNTLYEKSTAVNEGVVFSIVESHLDISEKDAITMSDVSQKVEKDMSIKESIKIHEPVPALVIPEAIQLNKSVTSKILQKPTEATLMRLLANEATAKEKLLESDTAKGNYKQNHEQKELSTQNIHICAEDDALGTPFISTTEVRKEDLELPMTEYSETKKSDVLQELPKSNLIESSIEKLEYSESKQSWLETKQQEKPFQEMFGNVDEKVQEYYSEMDSLLVGKDTNDGQDLLYERHEPELPNFTEINQLGLQQTKCSHESDLSSSITNKFQQAVSSEKTIPQIPPEVKEEDNAVVTPVSDFSSVKDTRFAEVNEYAKLEYSGSFKVIEQNLSKALLIDQQEKVKALKNKESFQAKTFSERVYEKPEFLPHNEDREIPQELNVEKSLLIDTYDESGEKDVELELPALKVIKSGSFHSNESTGYKKMFPSAPMFTKEMESQEVCEGDSCTFTCIFNGYPQPTVSWYNNDKSVSRNEDVVILTTETKSTLTFSTVLPQNSGSITCVIFNQYGTDTTFGKLKVKSRENQDQSEDKTLMKCEMLISEHFTEGEDEELVSLFANAEERSLTGRNRFSLQLPYVGYEIHQKSDISLSFPVEIKVTAPTPVPDFEELEETFQTVEIEQKKSTTNHKQKIKHKFTFGFDVSSKAKEAIQENEIQVDVKEEACPVLECIISEDSEPQLTWHQIITDTSKEDKAILENEAQPVVPSVSLKEPEGISTLIACDTEVNDNLTHGIDKTIIEKRSTHNDQIDLKVKVQSPHSSNYDGTDITDITKNDIVRERKELDDTVSSFAKDIENEKVERDAVPQSTEEQNLTLSVIIANNKNVHQESVSTVLQFKSNETIEIKLDAAKENSTEQSLGVVPKDLVIDATRKDLPMVPKRRRSFIKSKSTIDNESKPVESTTFDQRRVSEETADMKKALPVVPQRRHSFVKSRSGTDNKTIFRKSSLVETISTGQRQLLNESANISVKMELPTPPPRRRSMVKTPVICSEPKPLEAKSIDSEKANRTEKENIGQIEQLVITPSEDNKFRLNLDKLVKKDDVQSLNEIADISYLGIFEGEDISNDYLMSIVNNESIECEKRGQHMNLNENNLEDIQGNDYLTEDISTSENVTSENTIEVSQFNIPHSQITTQSPSVLLEDVKNERDFKIGQITSLEVEDVTFDTVYEFYKNQSARPFSPESEMSIEASSIFSDEAIDIEQFFTPPSSSEHFHSPLSEAFLTPATSPDRYFTPVQQMLDSDGTERCLSSDIAGPSQIGLTNTGKVGNGDEKYLDREVQKPPAFVKPFLKKRIFENNTLSFAAEVVGCPSPVVTWCRDSAILKQDVRIKIREEGNVHILEIHNIQLNEGGKYSCIAVNPMGEAKSFTQVDILPLDGKSCALPPPVTHQHVMEFDMEENTMSRSPSPQEILLEVELDESEVKDFEKQVKIITIPEFSPESKSMVISLDVLPLAFDDQNTGSESKDTDDVKINFEVTEKPPQFHEHISDLNVAPGSDAEFHCSVNGMPTPTIKWFKESECITSDSTKFVIKEEREKQSLAICDVNMSDAATYICKAENSYGEVSCRALLAVTIADAAKDEIKESIDFPLVGAECTTQGFEETIEQNILNENEEEIEVEFEFQSDNEANKAVELIAITGSECEEGNENCLNIQFEVFDKPSSEEAIQFNAKGSESCCFEFQVTQSPPNFLIPILDSTASLGTKANFKCVVDGTPVPDVCWYKDDSLVQGEKYVLEEDQNGCHQLTIDNVDAGDEGQYKCLATNKEGTAETIASLIIKQ